MTTLIICLFIALLLPFIAKLPVAIAMQKLNGYDNKHPRSQQDKLTGFGARALAAHQNAFESVIIFAPAILLAIITNHTGEFIQQLAITHVVARVIYNALYLYNKGTLRSVVWAIGIFCSFTIIWQCL
ncbi:MAPEG family protein [Colwellia sp. 1_MG-2023]|uniref:MAPEG family protein n=1 Tax=Colwellia sp. 1_MG-2023 TaxID=3062649 RepID=UPI0026E36EED|nr:MAPEG family protein [Colwellia sp. 1_MG-2023]MDO6444513.1 MAPEG family protein [Colwellia sp. 1_MG-2023]